MTEIINWRSFIAVGMTPQTEIYKNSGIEMNEKRYIVAGENCKTNILEYMWQEMLEQRS